MAKFFSVPGSILAEKFEAADSSSVSVVPTDPLTAVKNFATGEFLLYPIRVDKTGRYDLMLRASSMFDGSAFRIEIDGKDVTGPVSVPNTGDWNRFQWVGKKGVRLTTGRHLMKVVSEKQWFNFGKIRVLVSSSRPQEEPPQPTPTPPPPVATQPPASGERQFFCTFSNGVSPFSIHAKDSSRVSLVSFGRDGGTAVKLTTLPGDSNVFGSGSSERCDLSLNQQMTDGNEGREAWWAHSVYFPDDYEAPPNGFGVAMDFHHVGSTGQANFHLDTDRWDGKMRFRGYGGGAAGSQDQNPYESIIGPIVKNVWYDFVYHVRWSSGSDGFMDAWVNGKKRLTHRGGTLYRGMGCYLKLANYHSPFGKPSSIIHDRVIRGTSPGSVSLTALEGI